jgi:hypothetical protein
MLISCITYPGERIRGWDMSASHRVRKKPALKAISMRSEIVSSSPSSLDTPLSISLDPFTFNPRRLPTNPSSSSVDRDQTANEESRRISVVREEKERKIKSTRVCDQMLVGLLSRAGRGKRGRNEGKDEEEVGRTASSLATAALKSSASFQQSRVRVGWFLLVREKKGSARWIVS